MVFVDTNVFLRFFLDDVTSHTREARHILSAGANGEVHLYTSLIVFFELSQVLSSFYKKGKEECIMILQDVLSLSYIDLPEHTWLAQALTLMESTSLDLPDAYNLVYAKSTGIKTFYTFDKKLQKVFQQIKI
jgi:predicted nucleic acid-binding protein